MTSLSAGMAVFAKLNDNRALTTRVTKIFPVVADEAVLPYIAYRRGDFVPTAVKQLPGCETVRVEVAVCAASYAESVELAEIVRTCLDRQQWTTGELHVRGCSLAGGEETWNEDCFTQNLVFNVKI